MLIWEDSGQERKLLNPMFEEERDGKLELHLR